MYLVSVPLHTCAFFEALRPLSWKNKYLLHKVTAYSTGFISGQGTAALCMTSNEKTNMNYFDIGFQKDPNTHIRVWDLSFRTDDPSNCDWTLPGLISDGKLLSISPFPRPNPSYNRFISILNFIRPENQQLNLILTKKVQACVCVWCLGEYICNCNCCYFY